MPKGSVFSIKNVGTGVEADLITRRRMVAKVVVNDATLSMTELPAVVARGRDRFLTFWTNTAQANSKEFVSLDGWRKTLRPVQTFENCWSPTFARTGVVYEYPLHQSANESKFRHRTVWLQKTWSWNRARGQFVLLDRRFVKALPPPVAARF